MDDETGSVTRTFLFSDVEGSTALIRQLRDAYTAVMGEHERLLREAWAQAGGRELDADGDSFFVCFRRPRQAVEAAVAAQHALAAHEWPEGVDLRVRIGIHTGEASPAGDQYVGLAVHRAARICDAGHGGQILLSGAVRESVADAGPAGVSFKDLGLHQFHGLPAPEALFQVESADLQSKFPPPRALASTGEVP